MLLYNQCREATLETRKRRPFVQIEICDLALLVLAQCNSITQTYMGGYDYMCREGSSFNQKEVLKETKADLDEIKTGYDSVARMISERLQRMYVVD